MTEAKYLYGASVQGIQSFIFQTNALREIAGASELVESICTDQFIEIVGRFDENKAIVTAAGNIKYVFDSLEECSDVVLKFPKQIMEFAPGITISQAVVMINGGEIEKEHIDELERKLRVQRSKPFRPFDVGLMAIIRSRRTGIPAVKYFKKDNEFNDLGVVLKRDAIKTEELETPKYGRLIKNFFGIISNIDIALDMKYLTKSKSDNYIWLAVIHADGNNMGIALQKLAEKTIDTKGEEFVRIFRAFSNALDLSTKEAARKAYLETMKSCPVKSTDKLPFRPIIIGGDDLTIICRADLALDFTKHFLKFFESESKINFNNLPIKIDFLNNGLTACAGIAYIKESYPFHYGYHLSETLCGEAKKIAKEGLKSDELTPSCLMFHKVQSSFVENYKEIKNKELLADDIHLDFGPYYLDKKGKPSVDQLQNFVKEFEDKDGSVIKSHLRQWLTDLHNNKQLASQKMNRLIAIGNQVKLRNLGLVLSKGVYGNKTPVYDWLTINSINQ
jgi:hypothetical protein